MTTTGVIYEVKDKKARGALDNLAFKLNEKREDEKSLNIGNFIVDILIKCSKEVCILDW